MGPTQVGGANTKLGGHTTGQQQANGRWCVHSSGWRVDANGKTRSAALRIPPHQRPHVLRQQVAAPALGPRRDLRAARQGHKLRGLLQPCVRSAAPLAGQRSRAPAWQWRAREQQPSGFKREISGGSTHSPTLLNGSERRSRWHTNRAKWAHHRDLQRSRSEERRAPNVCAPKGHALGSSKSARMMLWQWHQRCFHPNGLLLLVTSPAAPRRHSACTALCRRAQSLRHCTVKVYMSHKQCTCRAARQARARVR